MSQFHEIKFSPALIGIVLAGLISALSNSYPAAASEDDVPEVFVGTSVEILMGGGASAARNDSEPGSVAPVEQPGPWPASPPAAAGSEPAPPSVGTATDAPVTQDPPTQSESEKHDAGVAQDGAQASDAEKAVDAAALVKQAQVLVKNEKYSSALGKFGLAVNKANASGDLKTLAAALHGAALAGHSLGKDEEALAYVNRSIEVNQTAKNARARSLDHILAARILMAQSKHDLALKSFEEAQKILPTSEVAEMPGLLEGLGTCLLRLYRYPEALAAFNRSLALYAKQNREIDVARLNLVVGEVLVSRSDYQGARAAFKKAEKTYRDHKRNKELGATLFRLAYMSQILGDIKSAQKAVEEGQALMGDSADTGTTALPLMVKGMTAYNDGRIIQAVKDLTTALALYEKSGDRIMEARARLALANLQLDRSQLKSALELGGKALSEFRELTDVGGEAGSLLLVGEVYYRQGFVQKALEYAQEASTISKKIHDKDQMVRSRFVLAEIHGGLGDADTASKLLQEALETAKTGINLRTRGHLRLAIGRFRLSREALDKALQAAAAAYKDFEEINDRRGMADCDQLTGMAYELQGERVKAADLLNRALNEHRTMWDRYGEGRDLTALGVHFKNMGDYDKALDSFKQALDLRKGIEDRRGYAANLANIGNLLRHRNQSPEAVKHLEQALAMYREVSDKKGEADILTNLGHVEASRGVPAAALEKFTAALGLHREVQDSRGVATDLTSIGKLYLARGDLENAAANLEEARKVNSHIRNPRGEMTILAELAMIHRARRNSAEALALLKKALEMAQQMNDLPAVSSIRLKTAAVLEDSGEFDKAMAMLRETLAKMKEQGDRKGELWAMGSIGIIQAKTEDYENALKTLQQALRLRSELGLPASQARDLDFYLAEIYDGFRDFERALEYYHKALSLYQTGANDVVLGRIYDRIGNIYYRTEEYEKSKNFFEDALRVHSEIRNVEMQKSELIRLGDVSSRLGDAETALKYQQRALALTRETKDERTEARILTRLGTLYQVLGRQRAALDHYKEARDIRLKIGDRRGVNENLLQSALVTATMGHFEAAVPDLKKAFEIAQCSEDRSMLWKAYFIMGRTLEGRKSPGEALESYRKAMTILEAMEADVVEESDEDDFIFGGKTALFETTLRVLMNLARKDPEGAYDNQALKIVEKLKAAEFENTLARINVESFSDLPHDLLIREKSLKLSLRRLNERLEEERSRVNPNQTQIQKLLEERRAKESSFVKLKNHLMKDYPAYADLRYPRSVSIHQIQKDVISRDEAILEYMVTRSRTYFFAIDKQRFHTFSVDYSSKDLERDIDAITRPLHRADPQASWDPSVAYRIYSKLIKPVEYFLATKKTVIIVPHGPLSELPFEILVDSKAQAQRRFWSATDRPSYLLEKYAFSYAPSVSVLAHVRTCKKAKQPGWTLVAFGDALYSDPEKTRERNPGADRLLTALNTKATDARGQDLKPLPGARKEISEIARTLGGLSQTYFGAQATETLFKKADLSRYAYVHLATHGLLSGGAGKFQQQPSIVFSLYGDLENDGFLEMSEVFGLNLNADMVAVSSCLTPGWDHPGQGSGITGLSRAFLFAGADSVVLSLWQVNHESTAKLFIEMYRNLKDGSKAEALRQSKLALLQDPATAHPYYWGPFVLMGNWQVRFHPLFKQVNPESIPFNGPSSWRKWLGM